jgi:hypothetical protein
MAVSALCSPEFTSAAQEAGRVITLTPGVTVQRGGQTLPLKVRDIVEPGDTLRTDATGRVRVLFSDDGSIALGSNTDFTLEAYVAEGSKASFTGRMAKGLLRSITGKIVEQNPSGFALSTPEATVGIRGSIVSMRSGNGSTSVYVENTLRQVYVNGTNVPQLNKITITPGQPPRIAPIAPQDRREIGRGLAFLGGNGSAAAAPEPGNDAGTTATNNLTASANELPDTPTLKELAVADLSSPALPLPPTLTMASVSGTLTTSDTWQLLGVHSGSFSFEVNLSSGAINNATLSASNPSPGNISTPVSYTFSGGSGSMSGGNFTINSGFSGTVIYGASTYPGVGAGSYMTGSGNVNSVGGSVTGSYYADPLGSLGAQLDAGTFSGTRTQ